jgi:hypothetical protein
LQVDGELGRPLDSVQARVGASSFDLPKARAGCAVRSPPRWPRSLGDGCLMGVWGNAPGCWDRREDRRRLCPEAFPDTCGTTLGDGWPSQVRAVDAPALQDVPAWEGKCGLAQRLWTGKGTNCESGKREPCRVPLTLLQAMQRGVDLIAIVPIQSATSHSEIRRVPAALIEVRPLDGSLHRRGRLQSEGLGERS